MRIECESSHSTSLCTYQPNRLGNTRSHENNNSTFEQSSFVEAQIICNL